MSDAWNTLSKLFAQKVLQTSTKNAWNTFATHRQSWKKSWKVLLARKLTIYSLFLWIVNLLDHPHVCISKEGECVIVTTLIMWGYKSDNDSAAELITGNNSNANRKPLHALHTSTLYLTLFKSSSSNTSLNLLLPFCPNVLLFSFAGEVDDGNVIVSSC